MNSKEFWFFRPSPSLFVYFCLPLHTVIDISLMNKEQIQQAIKHYLSEKGYERMDLRAAMFDMDGVLFDSMKNHAKSWYETMQHFGYSDFTEKEAYMHEGRTGAGTINIVKQRMFGTTATEDEVQEMYKYKSDLFNSLPKAVRMPSALEVLQGVKASGVVPMVVTGSGQKTLLDRLNRNFPEIFSPELMVTAFDVKYGKPNPEPYLMGMKKFEKHEGKSFTPNNFIVIENAPLGVQAGVAAGVFTIAVNTGPLDDEVLLGEGANILFHSMHELAEWWQELAALLTHTPQL